MLIENKLNGESFDIVDDNVSKLKELFPEIVSGDNQVDIDALADIFQKKGYEIVDDSEEHYNFTWWGKKESKRVAKQTTTKTLRPSKKDSKNWDSTQNIYIEGDNLDALKILMGSYRNRIKMIYIDPPYNTGNDFVYNDDFAENATEYLANSGQYDEQGNKLVQNTESNGRFHTDWLNMIYPRLKIAKDLLTDDGVIFISIDENEVQNMRKICDEIFGEANFISQLGWQKVYSPKNQARYFSNDYEFVLCYSRNIENFTLNMLPRTPEMNARYKNPDNDPRGDWKAGDCVGAGVRKNGYYEVVSPISGKIFTVPQGKHWVYAPENMKKMIEENRIWFGKDGNSFPAVKQFLSDVSGRRASSLLMYEDYGHTDMAKKDLIKLFTDLEKVPFDTPKPVKLIKMLMTLGTNDGDIILDFFAGSGTTGQAVMELNSENGNGKRKFILVQLPEKIVDNKGANEIGLYTISDVTKERIRRAGVKIKEENGLTAQGLDVGFRVLKLDSSNMKEVYYRPEQYQQTLLDDLTDNIKADRTPLDLLFQVMLDLGKPLSAKIEEKEIAGKRVFIVNDDDLIACFDDDVTSDVVKTIAEMKPLYAVFRDSSLADDCVGANFDQIFATYSPNTTRRVL